MSGAPSAATTRPHGPPNDWSADERADPPYEGGGATEATVHCLARATQDGDRDGLRDTGCVGWAVAPLSPWPTAPEPGRVVFVAGWGQAQLSLLLND